MSEATKPDATTDLILASPDLEALLWPACRIKPGGSAWNGHVSFAHWIVQAIRPGVVVELGTLHGVSYAAFCNAVAMRGLPTKCFAVDTWRGDVHTKMYEDDVYLDLKKFNDTHFSQFSTLVRSTFDEALVNFPDRSIDLLHIDGLHTYEAVQHDFETWRPKLSDRAVVLFHDVAARVKDFGVWKLWAELEPLYPHFSFEHAFGLGVLAFGPNVPPPVAALCAVRKPHEVFRIRRCMERFSEIANNTTLQEDEVRRLDGQVKALTSTIREAAAGLAAAVG